MSNPDTGSRQTGNRQTGRSGEGSDSAPALAGAVSGGTGPAPDSTAPVLDYGALQQSIGYQIHLAQIVSMQGFAGSFAGTGVTPAMVTALELIARNPGIRPASLARAMAVETSNLAALLRRLESAGWLTHGRSADRRAKPLALTGAGTRTIAALRRRLQRHDADLTAALDETERAQLSALIGKLITG